MLRTKRIIRGANGITEGVIWKQLLAFFFPIVLGTFFQQLYNTVDAVVVGNFVGKEALAAVGGATGTLINLLVGFFVGVSSGATVVISQFYGAKRVQETLGYKARSEKPGLLGRASIALQSSVDRAEAEEIGRVACRAVLEATAFQANDIFSVMEEDSGVRIQSLKVDGGMTNSIPLMAFQADIMEVPVIRPQIVETTSLGAAYAAGLTVGVWKDLDELRGYWKEQMRWLPTMDDKERENKVGFWKKAVRCTLGWMPQGREN